ncbi:toxin-like outer membrane protein [Helicobacter pylori]|nr:toxin-like outer membrane protein [Helicobacter pylori]
MKKFKKKPKKITRNQKTILKRPLWLAPLLISGFASGVYANNLWDLLNSKVGGEYVHWVKGSQYCAWWEFAGCLKNVWGANHKGYDAGKPLTIYLLKTIKLFLWVAGMKRGLIV